MTIDVRWGLENHIILTTGFDEVTVADLANGSAAANALLNTVPGNIHDVLDFRAVTKHPSLPQLIEFRAFFTNPKLSWLIIISNDKIITFFSSMIAGINNNRIRAFSNPEAAVQFLLDRDETLPRPLELPTLQRADLK